MTSRLVPLALILVVGSGPALAVRARSWSVSSGTELEAGTLEGTAIDEQGRLRLAPQMKTLWGPEPGIVWDLAWSGDKGDDGVFVGLSSPARLLRVTPREEPETWFETDQEGLIAAVLPDRRGGVYFGLSPGGRVFHATRPGEVAEIAATGSQFIWALDDTPDGALWIGTGTPGLVLKRVPSGEVQQVFDAGDDPVRSLVAREDGTVFVGTGGEGRVIRIDASGRPFVLIDADEAEIVSLLVADGGDLFALAARGAKQVSTPVTPGRGVVETVRVTAAPPEAADPGGAEIDPQGEAASLRVAPQRFTTAAGAVLYRLTPAGDVRRVWQSADEVPFTLAHAPQGGVLVATGDRGRIWHVDELGRAAVLASVPSEQATAIASSPRGPALIGATTDARIEQLGPELRELGSYLTAPIDAGTLADWGRLAFDADLPRGARLQAWIRAGNTSEPDRTWSEWIEVKDAGGAALEELPATRWVQARFDLRPSGQGESPLLRRIELFYRPRNREPAIEELLVQPAGVVWTRSQVQSLQAQGPAVADDPVARETVDGLGGVRLPRPIRKSYELGARTVTWRASDPDGDALQYRVEVRTEPSGAWVTLARHVEEEFLGFDTRGMPDGLYRVQLTADDGRDNPGVASLSDRERSKLFAVDNTRPTVREPHIRRDPVGHAVRFVAADDGGRIATVEIAVDGGAWRPIDPLDGVADSAVEAYETTIAEPIEPAEPLAPETRTVRVRVTDSAGNLGGDAWPLD